MTPFSVELRLVEDQTAFALISFSKKPSTVSGDTEKKRSSTVTQTPSQFHAVAEFFLRNQVLEPLHDLPGAFDVTRRSDTDCDFHDGGSFPSMFFGIYS